MSIAAELAQLLDEVSSESPGTFVHGGVTYPVMKAFSTGDAATMLNAGYDLDQVDLVVLLKTSLVQGNGPLISDSCTLDGTEYQVKSPVGKNAAFWTIPLRKL